MPSPSPTPSPTPTPMPSQCRHRHQCQRCTFQVFFSFLSFNVFSLRLAVLPPPHQHRRSPGVHQIGRQQSWRPSNNATMTTLRVCTHHHGMFPFVSLLIICVLMSKKGGY
jgi:hypothetical protein